MTKLYDGIDVSSYQGNINWHKVEAGGVKVAIIKAGEYLNKHSAFETYYTNARTSSNVMLGAYWFAHATSVDEAKAEAAACIEAIKGKRFEYPIYYDIEMSYTFESGCIDEIITAFCDALAEAGYFPGVYCSTWWYETYVSQSVRDKYPAWIADYRGQCYYKSKYGMWQYDAAYVAGVQNNCDRNEVYEDYSDYVKKNELNGFTATEPMKKTVDELAQEVLNGLWGNGIDRRNRLTQAGYSYEEVQKAVNAIVYAPKKTVDELANEVLAGKWGNGDERYRRLTDAGYDYYQVQRKVNELVYAK